MATLAPSPLRLLVSHGACGDDSQCRRDGSMLPVAHGRLVDAQRFGQPRLGPSERHAYLFDFVIHAGMMHGGGRPVN